MFSSPTPIEYIFTAVSLSVIILLRKVNYYVRIYWKVFCFCTCIQYTDCVIIYDDLLCISAKGMIITKLISWNVNGLRACMQKGFIDFVNSQDADYICIQETKMQEGQADIPLDGYNMYFNSAEKKGYSGTAVFTPHKPLSVVYDGMNIEAHSHEGRMITIETDSFYLVNVYTPNAQDGLKRLDYRMHWEEDLRDYLTELDKKKPVIYCGDLNVAHKEIDLKNPKSNRGNAGFSDEEREKIGILLDSGFTDSFRYLYPEAEGRYSWWSYRFNARKNNAGWRIDYFIVSDRIKDKITRADILSDVYGSDHCPVLLEIDI